MRVLPNPVEEAENRRKHGLDFSRVGDVLASPHIDEADGRPLGYEHVGRRLIIGRLGMGVGVVVAVIEPVTLGSGEAAARAHIPAQGAAGGSASLLEGVRMSGARDAQGNWLRAATDEELEALTEDEVSAAVASDPDAAPIRTEAEMEAADASALERDKYGVFRLLRRLKVGQVVFASRYRIPLRTVQEWERGEREPDPPAKVLLAATAADPEFMARAAQRASGPGFLLDTPARAAAE